MKGPAVIAVTQLVIHAFPGVFRFPETQCIHRMVLVSQHRHIIGHGPHGIVMFVYADQRLVFSGTHIGLTAKTNLHGFIRFPYFPGKTVAQPGIRQFHLLAVDNALVEKSVLVTDTAAMSRQLQGCHRIDITGSQAS